MCMYVHFAWKGHPRNDLYCDRWDVKPYTLTHSLDAQACHVIFIACCELKSGIDIHNGYLFFIIFMLNNCCVGQHFNIEIYQGSLE